MKHILDRPVWSALTTRQATLAEGGDLARRYQPSIVPFASARDDSPEALAALGALAADGQSLLVVQADPIVLPAGCVATLTAEGVQMLLKRTPPAMTDTRIERLTEADAPAMLELATLTKPGPFSLRAQALGEFFGVRIGGRLAAMAGERMKQDGMTEISGVCAHPDFQGRGLGRLLSVFMANRILARRETPFLHAYATNAAAIRLYESIGFELRTMMHVAAIRAAGAAHPMHAR
jgi:ribosomal protein S18 acetylase RimI-like enzyme